ncbi:MAG: AmmeMemoRadiSam system protein A [Candidatus Margulisiibacteriota bacterium]
MTKSPQVKLAYSAIETYLKTGKIISPPVPLPAALAGRAGVFVSLKKQGELRGCIGTFAPTTKNIAEEIIRNALESAFQDPRFSPLHQEALGAIEISVDVLTEPEPVKNKSELDAKRFGVIVKAGSRRGLLLPDLPGVETPDHQIEICRLKGGIAADCPVELFRFEVKRYH